LAAAALFVFITGVTASGNGHGSGGGRGCALVTGAARGIGAAVARALAGACWPVAVNYCSDGGGAADVVAGLSATGAEAIAVGADVSDPAGVEAMFCEVEERFGHVAVLVNNAGRRADRLVVELTPEAWSDVLAANLTGTFLVTRRALPEMIRARFGRVINISTIAASTPLAGQAAYAASKAGIEALTKVLALEVARRGITVNAVAPGLVDTGFVPEMTSTWQKLVPARRIASPEEIAAAVRFLASPEAGYVNGAVIPIDGGLRAGLPTPKAHTAAAARA
jgi:3-oxoacyl-[acyl-carrier protein] reductase